MRRQINIGRNERFARKSLEALASIAVAGSLGSECAKYHLYRKVPPADFWLLLERATKSRKARA